jgi:hypothetical protein
MGSYRIYWLHEEKAIGRPRIVQCENDREAMQVAHRCVENHDLEVWTESRLVGIVRAGGEA